jgi:NDP-hexose 4-ketoreductase
MKVLVTGAGGYIGSRVCARLRTQPGVTVLALGRRASATIDVSIDLATAPGALGDCLREFQPTAVVNCAGTISADPGVCFDSHVVSTTHLLDAVATHAAGARFVQLGSAAEYGQAVAEPGLITEDTPPRPVGPYGVSKLASTLIARHQGATLGLDCTVLRIFNLLGPGMPPGTIVPRVLQLLRTRNPADPVELGPLGVYRDFVHVDDVVDAIVAAAGVPRANAHGVINIASGQAVLVRDLVRMLLQAAGHHGEILESAHGSSRSGFVVWQRANIARAAAVLGWKPRRVLHDSIAELARGRE